MLRILALLSFAQIIPYGTLLHACIPHSQFHANGRLCSCDTMGRWSEANCEASRHQTCKPGQIVWEGCSQCICQENGHMICTNHMCSNDAPSKTTHTDKNIDLKKLWCIPFMSYYVNCSLCVCPVSGKMNDARCATDSTCPFVGITNYMAAVKTNVCIPKVMYLFPCLSCLCSDDGFFIVSKCVETCQLANPNVVRRCVPKTFFRKDCNICFCPGNGITDNNLCTTSPCSHRITLEPLLSLINKTRRCQRQTFTGKTCFYCECAKDSSVNEKSCLESNCMSIDDFGYNSHKSSCSVGEMVQKCMECLCLRDGATQPKYCTKECGDDQRLMVLEDAVKDSLNNQHVLDRTAVKRTDTNEICEPNTIYKEEGRYCLCPENGHTNIKLCTSIIEEHHVEKTKIKIRENTVVDIDFNFKCDPNTFVDFDCNTCYCMKTGRVDPKWCTYDDCESKRTVMYKQKHQKEESGSVAGPCTPGSISKEKCNYCICPNNGHLKERACTKNKCAGSNNTFNNALACEPSTYYIVDCNICYCPKNGIKNVAKCTKNTCGKTFLRSEVCVPGRLFSEECNVCICPSNGDKADRVCTNNTCNDLNTPWKKIFQLSQSLMSYQKMGDTMRNLELCFPGEEFEVGCKVCLCPDMGLRVYATCTEMLCDEENIKKEIASDGEKPVKRVRRFYSRHHIDCLDMDDDTEPVKKCTPGSMYIIKCQECICPYAGNIANFCRPLPKKMTCEQAYPGINFLIGRRDRTENSSTYATPLLSNLAPGAETPTSPHAHTPWACSVDGRMMDGCFICECEGGVIIQEHCFKSDQAQCINSTRATFLKYIKLPEA